MESLLFLFKHHIHVALKLNKPPHGRQAHTLPVRSASTLFIQCARVGKCETDCSLTLFSVLLGNLNSFPPKLFFFPKGKQRSSLSFVDYGGWIAWKLENNLSSKDKIHNKKGNWEETCIFNYSYKEIGWACERSCLGLDLEITLTPGCVSPWLPRRVRTAGID